VLLLACLVPAACRIGQHERPEVINPDSAAAADIRATMDEYRAALLAGDAARIAAFFTPDAVLLEPDTDEIVGVRAIHARIDTVLAAGAAVTELTVATELLHADGPVAFEFGTFAGRYRAGGAEAQAVHGRYIIHWQRGPEARWHIRRLLLHPLPVPVADRPPER
jgi:uncharacterized protein (TIGR02246 family)